MAYKLRYVQHFKQNHFKDFIELEKKFIELENSIKDFPRGKRFLPYMGKEPLNTLIWECEFDSMEELQKAHDLIQNNSSHEELYNKQVRYFLDSYTEIYKEVNI
ncbi:MAG: hypothetical protein ACM3XR_00545 [Bacillota bacterium]